MTASSGESGQAVCHYCQQPGADRRRDDGEVYHGDCYGIGGEDHGKWRAH